MSKLLVQPSRCTGKLPKDLGKDYLVAEEKIDGSRYLLYIGYDPYERREGNTLLSRRLSTHDNKNVDKTDNMPHVTHEFYEGLEGTILDGEVIMSGDFLKTNSVMNSSPNRAAFKQGLEKLQYHVFDVISFRGEDIRPLPLEQRRKVLKAVVERMNNPYVSIMPQFDSTHNFENLFKDVVSRGGEGLIIKDKRMAYGMGWAKMKKVFDVSCVISGWKPGTGKYRNGLGSIELGVYHKGELYDVGFCSGFDDKLRMEMHKNFSQYEGKVVDVFIHEMQDSSRSELGRFRHATFHRLRDDVNGEDCTFDKLQSDLEDAKATWSRDK